MQVGFPLQGRYSLGQRSLRPWPLYDARPDPASRPAGVGGTALHILALLGVVLGAAIVIGTGLDRISPRWLLLWLAIAFVATLLGHSIRTSLRRTMSKRGILTSRTAIVGADQAIDRLITGLSNRLGLRLELAGVFDDEIPAIEGQPLAGTVLDLLELGKHWALDRVLVAVPLHAGPRLAKLVDKLKALDAEIVAYPHPTEASFGRANVDPADGQFVRLVARPITGWGAIAKALLDKVLGLLLLMAALPLMAVIAIGIWLDSPGPVLYRQHRHGRNNCEFEVLKFRTMVSRDNGPCQQTTRDDPRVTRLGRFLRRSSLDELPQLWNVLRGDMSLVGPRPHPIDMRTRGKLGDEISHHYPHRHRVKPGLTGLAQVSGCRGATEFHDELIQRLEYDIAYVENWSIWLDLKIILITPWCLLFPRGRAF